MQIIFKCSSFVIHLLFISNRDKWLVMGKYQDIFMPMQIHNAFSQMYGSFKNRMITFFKDRWCEAKQINHNKTIQNQMFYTAVLFLKKQLQFSFKICPQLNLAYAGWEVHILSPWQLRCQGLNDKSKDFATSDTVLPLFILRICTTATITLYFTLVINKHVPHEKRSDGWNWK